MTKLLEAVALNISPVTPIIIVPKREKELCLWGNLQPVRAGCKYMYIGYIYICMWYAIRSIQCWWLLEAVRDKHLFLFVWLWGKLLGCSGWDV